MTYRLKKYIAVRRLTTAFRLNTNAVPSNAKATRSAFPSCTYAARCIKESLMPSGTRSCDALKSSTIDHGNPRPTQMLMICDPTQEDVDMAPYPLRATVTALIVSGISAPIATKVRPKRPIVDGSCILVTCSSFFHVYPSIRDDGYNGGPERDPCEGRHER
eukprot:GEMP01063481.1.p1 GENE.GEMP01063481.1~~GEMP01063481.1.p1  ORF type:complete len:161 (-),score=25.43 GEMP01063481.1:595-1077(-)